MERTNSFISSRSRSNTQDGNDILKNFSVIHFILLFLSLFLSQSHYFNPYPSPFLSPNNIKMKQTFIISQPKVPS